MVQLTSWVAGGTGWVEVRCGIWPIGDRGGREATARPGSRC